MKTVLDSIYDYTLISSIVIGLLLFIQNKKYNYLHTLPLFLIFIYYVELYGVYLTNHSKQNAWLYNYSSVAEVAYYMWLISKMYIQKEYFKIATLLNISIIIISLTNIIFFQGKKGFHSITFGMASIIAISFCIYYYYQLFIFPTTTILYKQTNFWIVTGIMFYYACDFPVFCLNNIYYTKVSAKIWPLIYDISNLISIIFYSLFIIAFLCKIKKFWR